MLVSSVFCGDFLARRFLPQFAGGGQHDAHELAAALLDKLHEDINRVTSRPLLLKKSDQSKCTSDAQAADLAWADHQLLGSSFVLDLIQVVPMCHSHRAHP